MVYVQFSIHAVQSIVLAKASAHSWHTTVSKKGSKSAQHINTGGTDMHKSAQLAVSGEGALLLSVQL